MFRLIATAFAAALLTALALPDPAEAQSRQPSHCIALARDAGLPIVKATWREPLTPEQVRISYLDHSMFLIQAGRASAVTDYTGFLGLADFAPDVATMNHAHSSHWTARPDPRIPHVLKGWGDGRTPSEHWVELPDMLVRNVATDIRSSFDAGGVEKFGNSIFVFEAAGLCIGHLGHLHHEPDAAQYAALGRLDVVMAAVDGGLTLDLPAMLRVLKRLRASVVIPMHWWGRGTLDAFVSGMEESFDIRQVRGNHVELSLRDLPDRPTVMILSPALLEAE